MSPSPFLLDLHSDLLLQVPGAKPAPHGKSSQMWLRELLHRHPDLIPIERFGEAFAPLVPLACGVDTGGGELDNLFVSPNGRLTLVMIDERRPDRMNQPVEELIEHGRRIARWSCDRLRDLAKPPTEEQSSSSSAPRTSEFDLRLCAALERADVRPEEFEELLASNLTYANFFLLVVGERISPEVQRRAGEVQDAWGLSLTLGMVELRFFQPGGEQNNSVLVCPQIVTQGFASRELRTMLDSARLALRRSREGGWTAAATSPPWTPALPPEVYLYDVPLATFENAESCQEFHNRLRSARIDYRTRITRAAAVVSVSRIRAAKAKPLLADHLTKHPDSPKTGFQVSYDYALFGALIASALGMILLAVEFRHPTDLVRPALLMLFGAAVGWVADKARIHRRATGDTQMSGIDVIIATVSAFLILIIFLSGLAQ